MPINKAYVFNSGKSPLQVAEKLLEVETFIVSKAYSGIILIDMVVRALGNSMYEYYLLFEEQDDVNK